MLNSHLQLKSSFHSHKMRAKRPKTDRQIVNQSIIASLGVAKIPRVFTMNFNKSSVTEIIVHPALIASEEFLCLISLSKKMDFCGSCCPRASIFFSVFTAKESSLSLISLAKWQRKTQRYACCSPVEAIRTLQLPLLFLSVVAIKESSTSRGDMDFKVSPRMWINYSLILKKYFT